MKSKRKSETLKSDAEDVIPQAEIIEADQYKRSYFGPDVPTLELECWEEELSEAQLAAYKTADEEYKSIQNKLDDIVKDTGGEIVYNGDQFTAYQLLGKQPVLKDLEKQSAEIIRSRSRSLSVAKESKSGKRGRPKKNRDVDYSPSPPPSPEPKKKKHKKDKDKKEKEKDIKTKDKTLAPSNVHSVVTNVRPSEATAVGGLATGNTAKTTAIVDLTKEDGSAATPKSTADSREVSFNKLQGKTFPSLVVVARPYLRAKDNPPSDRTALDSKVKSVLMHTPTKFTEWLIQQGLVRSEQWCAIHSGSKLKLGMYSDVSKFPYSGGYVWISECCPTRFVSVFCSSIFEGATHPPSVLLKLIYHWACQTNVQNVVQWVKVDNLYVKGLFTWLRAICTSAIHQHQGLLGGPGKKVEVGVISLGTTSHDGTQRQVKVEVLGVLDPVEKLIRLRAVEPLSEQEKNYKKRFQKILEPLNTWVHPSSTILTDLTVDKSTLISMGFKTIHQSSSHGDANAKNSNANIMEYLRRIVPRMFQNTLSLLSRQIIQQFLDELVWREKYGISPGMAFDNIVSHISEQTKMECKDKITVRLNKIAANPFKNWKYSKKSDDDEPTTSSKKRGKRKAPTPPPPPKKERKKKEKTTYVPDDDDEELQIVSVTQPPKLVKRTPHMPSMVLDGNMIDYLKSLGIKQQKDKLPLAQRRKNIKQEKDKEKEPPKTENRGRRKRERSTYTVDDELDDIPLKNIKKEAKEPKEPKEEETVSMEKYYFGQVNGADDGVRVAIAVDCPVCNMELNNNIELMKHMFVHAVPAATSGAPQCIYCLERFDGWEQHEDHLKNKHPNDTKTPGVFTYACLICEVRVPAVLSLRAHMQKAHVPLELPYRCGLCPYRVSAHRRLVDHYTEAHTHHHTVCCPSCLKMFKVYEDGHELTANVALYLDHLKLHQDKNLEVKCNICVLTFVHLGHLKEHQIRDHTTVDEALPICNQEHLITKPKNKPRFPVKDATGHVMRETYDDMEIHVPPGQMCRECDTDLDAPTHFLGTSTCLKCPYSTSCYRALLRHQHVCAGIHSLEDAPRPAPYVTHCVCGYNTHIGTDMLSHLLVCEHKTAYSSEEEARANTVGYNAEEAAAKDSGDTQSNDQTADTGPSMADYAPPSVLNTQLSLDDLAPPSVLQSDQHDQELLKDAYDRPLATPRHEDPQYGLGDFEPLPQEPTPQPDFEQL